MHFRDGASAELRSFAINGGEQLPLWFLAVAEVACVVFKVLRGIFQPSCIAFRLRKYFLEQVVHTAPQRCPPRRGNTKNEQSLLEAGAPIRYGTAHFEV